MKEKLLFLIALLLSVKTFAQTNAFHLVKDIDTLTDSYPFNNNYNNYYDSRFAVLNNVAYFDANDGIHGEELWRSDGTATGTYLVKDVAPGAASSIANQITIANGKIFLTLLLETNFGYRMGLKPVLNF